MLKLFKIKKSNNVKLIKISTLFKKNNYIDY